MMTTTKLSATLGKILSVYNNPNHKPYAYTLNPSCRNGGLLLTSRSGRVAEGAEPKGQAGLRHFWG